MLTFFHSFVEARVLAAYHRHCALVPEATTRLARVLVERYPALLSNTQQAHFRAQIQNTEITPLMSEPGFSARLKQGAYLWAFWVLGSVWGWSWIVIGLAAAYGLGYTALGHKIAQVTQFLGWSSLGWTAAVIKKFTPVFWYVVAVTTAYWAFGVVGFGVGILLSAILFHTPEGDAFLKWAASAVQYVGDSISGVWTETLLSMAALNYAITSARMQLSENASVSAQFVVFKSFEALKKRYMDYQDAYQRLRPGKWNIAYLYARYRLQGVHATLVAAWEGYHQKLKEQVEKNRLFQFETIVAYSDPIELVQYLVTLRTCFATDPEILARLPSMLGLIQQLPLPVLTKPSTQPLVEGNTGRSVNFSLLQVAGQASLLVNVLVSDNPWPYAKLEDLKRAIDAEVGNPVLTEAVLPVLQLLLLKLPRARSKEVLGCLSEQQQQGVLQQLEQMHHNWCALGTLIAACLQGACDLAALDRTAVKNWLMTYYELQDNSLESIKKSVQHKIITFFKNPTIVLSVEILAVLDCLETSEDLAKYQNNYLQYWLQKHNERYVQSTQALVVSSQGLALSVEAAAFLRQEILPHNLSWFEVLTLQLGIACHPLLIADLHRNGCVGLSGMLRYYEHAKEDTLLLTRLEQKELVLPLKKSTELFCGDAVSLQALTQQIFTGSLDGIKQNIEAVNRVGALGQTFLAYGQPGSVLPPELFVHLEYYLNANNVLEGEFLNLLKEMVKISASGIFRLLKEEPYYLKKLWVRSEFWEGLSFAQMRELIKQHPDYLPQLGLYYGLAAQRAQLCVLPETWEMHYKTELYAHQNAESEIFAKRVMPYTAFLVDHLSAPLIEDFHAVKYAKASLKWQARLDLQFLFGYQAIKKWSFWWTLYLTHRFFKKNNCAHYWTAKLRDTLRYDALQELKEDYKDDVERKADYRQVCLKIVMPVLHKIWAPNNSDEFLLHAIGISALCRKEDDILFLWDVIVELFAKAEPQNITNALQVTKKMVKDVFEGRKKHPKFVADLRGVLRFHKKCTILWSPLMPYPKQGQQIFEKFPILTLTQALMRKHSVYLYQVAPFLDLFFRFTEEQRWKEWISVGMPNASISEEDSDDDLQEPTPRALVQA